MHGMTSRTLIAKWTKAMKRQLNQERTKPVNKKNVHFHEESKAMHVKTTIQAKFIKVSKM